MYSGGSFQDPSLLLVLQGTHANVQTQSDRLRFSLSFFLEPGDLAVSSDKPLAISIVS